MLILHESSLPMLSRLSLCLVFGHEKWHHCDAFSVLSHPLGQEGGPSVVVSLLPAFQIQTCSRSVWGVLGFYEQIFTF